MKLLFDGVRSDKYIVIVSKVLGQIIRCSPLLVEVSDLTPVQIKIYSWSRHWYVERLIDSLLGFSEAYSGRQKFSLGVLSECQLSSAVIRLLDHNTESRESYVLEASSVRTLTPYADQSPGHSTVMSLESQTTDLNCSSLRQILSQLRYLTTSPKEVPYCTVLG